MKTQIKQTIAKLSALAFVFSLVVGVAPQSEALTDDLSDNDVLINAEVVMSMQLTVDNDVVNIQVDPDVNNGTNATGGVVSDSTTTTVSTNHEAGYSLSIQLNGAEVSANAQLDGSGTTASIATGTGFTENSFGFALNNDSATGSVLAFEPSATPIPSSGLDAATNGDDETIYYYLNVDYTVPAATYLGTVTYTAVAL